MGSNINSKKIVMVKWIKPFIGFVKLNSDGSSKNKICGGGGIVRDHVGNLVFAYSLKLGK